MNYNLSHLTQTSQQIELGPIQDDEALLLYALVRVMLIRNIVEVGGLSGYSAKNFLAALQGKGTLTTIDVTPVESQASNHKIITKSIELVEPNELLERPIELLFFDCHRYNEQISFYQKLAYAGKINDKTIIALHDTNLQPYKVFPYSYPVQGGYVHEPVERAMVNTFMENGWHAFNLHSHLNYHDESLPFRHGLTLLNRPKKLLV